MIRSREWYLPHQPCRKVEHKAAPAVVYLYEVAPDRPCAVGFYGKSIKPSYGPYRYASDEKRAAAVEQWLKAAAERAAYKAKVSGETKAKLTEPHGLKVGQVLVSSWGYDQTNVNFYEVVRLAGKRSVMIAPIRSMECHGSKSETYGDRGYCEPSDSPERRSGEPRMARVGARGEVKIGHRHAHAWDGKPCYWSAYA